jgi:hypothetical protein
MKKTMKSAAVVCIAALAVTSVLAKGGGGQPVHTIRFNYKVAFTNTGADANIPNAAGSAQASESLNIGNNTDRETLNVTLKGLEPSTPYSLFATTTTSGSADAADFNTDKKGNAKVSLSTKPGKSGVALGNLDPLSGVTELDIVDESNTNGATTVLTADTTTPSTFTFQDKQTQPGAGSLNVSASSKSSKLSLKASGLTGGDTFALSLVGGTITSTNDTFTASSGGTVNINTSISGNVLDITEVDLTDTTTSTTVLTFPMP